MSLDIEDMYREMKNNEKQEDIKTINKTRKNRRFFINRGPIRLQFRYSTNNFIIIWL